MFSQRSYRHRFDDDANLDLIFDCGLEVLLVVGHLLFEVFECIQHRALLEVVGKQLDIADDFGLLGVRVVLREQQPPSFETFIRSSLFDDGCALSLARGYQRTVQ